MKVVSVGYSSFNADALESLSLDQLKERYPDMRADTFKELAGKLGITKKRKTVDKSKDDTTED